MARTFVTASSQFINFPTLNPQLNGVSTYSMMARVKVPSIGAFSTISGHRPSTTATPFFWNFFILGSGVLGCNVRDISGNSVVEEHTVSLTADVWENCAFVRDGTTVETFLNAVGSGGTTNGSLGTSTTASLFDLGAITDGSSTRVNFAGFDLCEVAAWDIALTQAEIDSYNDGMSPLLIRPQNLIFYAPLWGNTSIPDLSGSGNVGTDSGGTTASDLHAPVGRSPILTRSVPLTLDILEPYAPPVDPDVDLNFIDAPYAPPTDPNVNFNIQEFVADTILFESELSNLYGVAVPLLNEGEVSNKYNINPASLDESEVINQYTVNVFRLAQGELSNKYAVAKAVLRLGELLNLYNVNPATLVEGELSNLYSVDAFRLREGELSNKYKVNPAFLLLSELQNEYEVAAPKLREGEVQQVYSVQDAKLEAQLLASYAIRFAKQFEATYGDSVARQLLAKAFFTLQKQFDAPYQIRSVVAKQLDSLFDITNTFIVEAQLEGVYSTSRITRQLDGSYSIGPVIQKQLDAPYILATVPVAKQLDSIFDITITNPVTKQLKGIYAILTTQIINITGQPTVTLNGEVLQIDSADVAIDEGSFVWRATIGILDIEDYTKFSINDEIILDLYGEIFNLIVESKNLTRNGPAEVEMGLIAVSPAIKFDFPRADALEISFTTPIFAEAAAEQALGGEDIDWQIIDWLIPANRLAIKDGAPIQLVKTIVEAAGGVLESKPDGQLVARPLFPVSIPDFDAAVLDQTYSDSSDNLSVSESFAPTRRLNLFRILDITASKRDSIEFEFDEDSVTEGDLKLFPSPFETNRVIKSSRGTEIGFQLIGVSTEQREQQVEFKEGFATLSRPIESIDTVVFEGQDLGALTFTQGDNKVFSASVLLLYGLATITYTTKFIKFRVTGVPETDVQFRAEVV